MAFSARNFLIIWVCRFFFDINSLMKILDVQEKLQS